MSVFSRPDSPFWWIYLEHARKKIKTKIRIGTTSTEQKDSRRQADVVYARYCLDYSAQAHELPRSRPEASFDAYADIYARDVISQHKGRVRELEILKRLRADFGRFALSDIDRDRVREWAATRRATVSASTVNREIDLLKSMLRDAAPKYIKASPIAGMRKLRQVPPRRTLLSAEDEARLLAACRDPQERALIIVGVDTLQRLSTLLAMKRTDRSADGKWIYVPDSKNGTAVDVPLSDDARAALDWLEDDGQYYFSAFRRAASPAHWRAQVRKRMLILFARAKLPPMGKPNGGVTWHWMTRRTGATRLLNRGVPPHVVQRIGIWHDSSIMLEIYADAQRDELAAAVGHSRSVHDTPPDRS